MRLFINFSSKEQAEIMTTLLLIIKSMRLEEWVKNLILFAPLIFSKRFFVSESLVNEIIAFFAFSFLSGAVYIFNDLIDKEHDKLHPVKSSRPIASGSLSPKTAKTAFAILSLSVIVFSYFFNKMFFFILLFYFFLQIAYSLYFKRIVILDVLIISAGFVLRIIAGAAVINVILSKWIILCTIFLSVFLGFCKRRYELLILNKDAVSHREVLGEYSTYFLDQMISIATASTVLCYALYTTSIETIEHFNTDKLMFTIPFVLYGIFRYLYLVHMKNEGGSPENLFITDRHLVINNILWILVVVLIIYWEKV
jgi:4-hydroxybenzoate polyprenyltransferase